MTEPTCQAIAEHFDIRCGAPATVVGGLGDRWGYLCPDDADRAVEHGWIIGPCVSDVRAFLDGRDPDKEALVEN